MKYQCFFIVLFLLVSCTNKEKTTSEVNLATSFETSTIQDKIANLRNSLSKEILVVAHRGDWRNAPENSIQAIVNVIEMGVDIVEIDIHETKDGHLVLIHDDSLERTTSGRGLVKNWTLDSLKTLTLKDGLGIPTRHRIPTLEEALLVTKDKILVNLDKSYDLLDKCLDVVTKTGTLNQVIIKGGKTRSEVERKFGAYLDDVTFMPVLWPNKNMDSIVQDYLNHRKPIAFEFIIPKDSMVNGSYFKEIREKGASVWVNSLWPHLSGGHDDDNAVLDVDTYRWYIENNINIIQTDRPKLLLDYLRSKGLHK